MMGLRVNDVRGNAGGTADTVAVSSWRFNLAQVVRIYPLALRELRVMNGIRDVNDNDGWFLLRNDIKNCDKCVMAKTRKNVVIGRGSSRPIVVFVGEAPGQEEDTKGIPFVGRSGQVLDAEIRRIGLSFNEYYILNACECRPIDDDCRNRKPTLVEIESCSSFLSRQLNLLKPKVVVLLGNSAKEAFGGFIFKGKILEFLHPAVCLYKPKMHLVFSEQFNTLKRLLDGLANGEMADKRKTGIF